MIDSWMVLTNGLWILGLAILLAALSLHSFASANHSHELTKKTKVFSSLGILWGQCLFFIGMSTSSRSWLERGLWGVLTLASVIYLISSMREQRIASRKAVNSH